MPASGHNGGDDGNRDDGADARNRLLTKRIGRNFVERSVSRFKPFCCIATWYEKTARVYLSMLCIAAARLWMKSVKAA